MNERVLLSALLASKQEEEPPVELRVPFAAVYGEAPKIVTAVLERTAVLAEPSDRYERVSVRHDRVLVDPAMVEWRQKTSTYEGTRWVGAPIKQRLKSPWRSSVTAPSGREAANSRAASDERAIKNRKDIKEAEEKELQFLRRRTAEQAAEQKEESEVIQSVNTNPGALVPIKTTAEPTSVVTRLKVCRRCKQEKPASEFPATGIYGGYCATCEPIEKAERAAARENGTRPKAKGGRRPKAATMPIATAVRKVDAEVTSNGYDHVVKLLHRRDSLKLELAKVNEQLQEALA